MLKNSLTREHVIDLNIALGEMAYVLRHLESLEAGTLPNWDPSIFEDMADHAARALMRVDALCDRLPSPDSLDAIDPSLSREQ